MAITNHERIGKGLELLRNGLAPFIDREVSARLPSLVDNPIQRMQVSDRNLAGKPVSQWDVSALLTLMWDAWNDIFKIVLGQSERNLVSELKMFRNKWAHQESFSTEDTYRMLDSAYRLLTAISSPEAEEVNRMKGEALRVFYDEQARNERRKAPKLFTEQTVSGALKPWREVVTPHPDVASGRFQEAEFAADLWQVYRGEGSAEYRDPIEFFKRTYLTASLKKLLVNAISRLSGKGGDPVVQLQTNFGGGKTHSMLALYHLFSGISPLALAGMEPVLQEAGTTQLPSVRRVVLVGTRLSPGNPIIEDDGTEIRTLWGELAWQLGGRTAYEKIRHDDEHATNPGDRLRQLFVEYGPCLILIDEWVAYARQLHDTNDLPAGSFDTQFTFAQTLTEAAKNAGNCLVVISLPASDAPVSPNATIEDVEVGGIRGRDALDRLRNVIGRVESSWRPATAEEGFEIVKRRLFEPMIDQMAFRDRDVVARAFSDLYRSQSQEFPSECRESEYEQKIKASYPIHPELFERLYTDWSTLPKFQRTRGVLRLMAMVIHRLWQDNDRSPLIMPSSIDMDDPGIKAELNRYLADSWASIIEKDIDGPNSLPQKIDAEITNLGKYSATRRVARTIYLGSAPLTDSAHKGIEDRRIKLGCVLPGEPVAVFGDALRRLAAQATYLYQDGNRYWYSLQPTVIQIAANRAEDLKRNPDKVVAELERRMRIETSERGDFSRIHVFPQSAQDVPDDTSCKVVIFGPDHVYGREAGSPAEVAAKALLESRGNGPRVYRNTLIFLAPDRIRMQDLEDAMRQFLAWESIVAEKVALDLTATQISQAENQRSLSDETVHARIGETYQWVIVPEQKDPYDAVHFTFLRVTGQEALAQRVCRKLKNEEHLLSSLGGSILKMHMDRIPLWRNNHVSIAQLVEDFAKYTYLPRLKSPHILLDAISQGLSELTWERDTFAYADAWDENEQRYRGLRAGEYISLTDENSPALLVKPEIAAAQLSVEMELHTQEYTQGCDGQPSAVMNRPIASLFDDGTRKDEATLYGNRGYGEIIDNASGTRSYDGRQEMQAGAAYRRFHGSVELDSLRTVRDVSTIMEEVISHLQHAEGATVHLVLEIDARFPKGVSETTLRTVTENARSLKFTDQGFEKD